MSIQTRELHPGPGNRLRHTGASHMPVPAVLGMHAVTLPPPSPFGNGETKFAGMHRSRPHDEHKPLDTGSALNEAA